MSSAQVVEVPVLITGAGPTGLAASLLLSRHGVESLTVERHPGTSIFPRATGINVRTMEIFRSLGLEDQVRAAAFTAVPRLGKSSALCDPGIGTSPLNAEEAVDASPSQWTSCSQFELEPILARAAAVEPLSRLLFGTEVVSVMQSDGGVCTKVLDRATGETYEVRSQYLIAADGSRSGVRESLGIDLRGPGKLQQAVNIHFHAPLRRRLTYEPNFLHFVENGETTVFAPTDSSSRWMLAVPLISPDGESRENLTESQAAVLVRKAAGFADLDVNILGTINWTLQADWAVRMRSGRVFLAGDAAHRMTPAGGYGLNTGVQDAHNLCWKLAAVLQGWAGPRLLDTYETERMPVGQFNTMRSIALVTGAPDSQERSAMDVDLGFVYESSAVIPERFRELQPDGRSYRPSASPGARAPHMWLDREMHSSTLDLFGPHLTLLAGPMNSALHRAPDTLGCDDAVPLAIREISCPRWQQLYGIDDGGAVLVRPDGHVAWRQRSASVEAPREANVVDAILAVAHSG